MRATLLAVLVLLAPLARAGEVPALPASAVSGPAAFSVPAEFTIKERVISLTDTFDLKAGDKVFGRITEKLISLTKSFTLATPDGACVAKARSRILSWGTHIDVTDCSGAKIGAIKEEVFKSLLKVHTTYAILDAADRPAAVSTKVDWIATSVTLTKPGGGAVATLDRRWLNILSDSWTVRTHDAAAVDPRLIVMIAAYKTSVDNDRRKKD
jgi:uncharacterized protein YxjI